MPFIPNPGLPTPAIAVISRQTPVELRLPAGGLKVGRSNLVLLAPEKPTASLSMPAMATMTIAPPVITAEGKTGEYRLALNLPHAGKYRLSIKAGDQAKSFDLDVQGDDDMAGMEMSMPSMQGVLGPWSMAREGSGTTWLADESPMFMRMLPKNGRYDLMYMGNLSLNYTDSNLSNGRGPHEFYSNSMPMLMARRGLSNGDTLGLRIMGSLDPIFNGQYGAPNLLQTGETAHGHDLVDRQHPHDLIAEVSATYSHPLGGGNRAFVYAAPVGEPALAGSMYLMRPSGMENPEAPISHHWFDSSHITFGVLTAGIELGDRLKVDASAFKGREPDENRYMLDSLKLDSGSARLTYSPARSLSLSASYGSLRSPEGQNPDQDEARTTAALSYGKKLEGDDWLAATALFGRNAHAGHFSDAYLLEGTLYRREWSYYARYENVAKDELAGVPEGIYHVDKLTLGATKDVAHRGGFDLGVGAYAGLYSLPSSLDPFYGRFPVSLGIYLRIRPSRMSHDMAGMAGM